jgi:phenylacetate-coenzyme A ligase PaaK-like adenylate-forming protein
MHRLPVHVEPRYDAGGETGRVAAELTHEIKVFVGVTAEVSVHPPGPILRPQGKAVRGIDHRRH